MGTILGTADCTFVILRGSSACHISNYSLGLFRAVIAYLGSGGAPRQMGVWIGGLQGGALLWPFDNLVVAGHLVASTHEMAVGAGQVWVIWELAVRRVERTCTGTRF